MTPTHARCPDCGSPMVGEFVSGLCPVCLMALAVKDGMAGGAGGGGLLAAEQDELIDGGSDPAFPAPGSRVGAAAVEALWIGPYRVVRRIAEGGMGVVYEAEQERPIARTVALKVVRAGMDSEEVLARFTSERQALALMSHANIAKVFDAGTSADGRPFFAMEFVPGEPITAYCDRHRTSTRTRLQLFVQACNAVQHAHNKGIIHRDIKPSNVLVTTNDGRPVVKVIDFGIAKALSGRLTEQTFYTEHGRLLGTPAYMSPEQLERGSLDVDTRADVYSLGVLLYELLSGSLPVDVGTSAATLSFGALRRALLAGEPPSPSSRLSALEPAERDRVATARGRRWPELYRELRAELEWIPLQAIRAERTERYRSCSQLADDVDNYLAGRALIAGPRTRAYLLRKLVRGHRIAVALTSMTVATFLGLLVWLSIVTTRAVRAEGQVREAAVRADQARRDAERQLVDELLKFGDRSAASKPADAREIYLDALETARRLHIEDASVLARLFAVPGPDVPLMGAYGVAGGVGGFPGAGHPQCLTLLDDERVAATCDSGTDLAFWDLRTGRLLRRWPAAHQRNVAYISASPDGKSLISGSFDHTVKLWDVRTGALKGTCVGHPGEVYVVVFSPDGRSAASGDNEGNVFTWDLANCSAKNHWNAHDGKAAAALAYSRDGSRLASGGFDGKVRVWNAATGALLEPWGAVKCVYADINTIAWNADETALFSGSFDGVVRRWDCKEPLDGVALDQQKARVWRIALSPDGTRLVAGYHSGAVRLFDANSGQFLRSFEGHTGQVMGVGFLHDGQTVVASGEDSNLRLWSTSDVDRFKVVPSAGRVVTCGAIADDGLTLLGTADGMLLICDAAAGQLLRTLPAAHGAAVTGVQFLADGTRAVTCARDGQVKAWDLASGHELKKLAAAAADRPALGLCATSAEAVVVMTEGGLVRWDVARDVVVDVRDPSIACVASSPGAGRILVAERGGQARWVDLSATSTTPRPLPNGPGVPTAAAVSSDGGTCGVARGNQFSWSVTSADLRAASFGPFTCGVGDISALAFLPAAHTALVAGRAGTVELWNLDQRRAVAQIGQGGIGMSGLTLAPDGRKALSIGTDGNARLWDFARGGVQESLETKVSPARAALQQNPNDPASLAAFADWYAFRGRPQWAVEFLKAAGAGAPVPHATRARLYGLIGDRAAAAQEYQLAARAGEVSPLLAYLWSSAPTPPAPALTTMPAAAPTPGVGGSAE